MARAMWALARAYVVYWLRVAPTVRGQLRRWETRAGEIPDPSLRDLALGKLANERFNVEVAAMIATTAPRSSRARAIRAIVALQVMYDYLDALTEQPTAHPLRTGFQSTQAFIDAVQIVAPPTKDYYAHYPTTSGDAGYLVDLAHTVRTEIAQLPAVDAIAEVILSPTTRVAETQVRIHAISHTGRHPLERWADRQATDAGLGWREWLFGAMGSVVAAHALIALAADKHTTPGQARVLDAIYLQLCMLTTALDHLVDYERDSKTGQQSYLYLFNTREELAEQITLTVARVKTRASRIPNGAHHLMILSGVVAYYTSQPGARTDYARPVTKHVQNQLRPLITPTLATLYAWRLAKRLDRLRHWCGMRGNRPEAQ
jgi:tetraprenyl-beta-curcumene synthase